MSSCGNGFYASSLSDPQRVPRRPGTAFISPDLGRGGRSIKSGYRLTMAEGSEATVAMRRRLQSERHRRQSRSARTTHPISQSMGGLTGTRWFWTNSLGTVFASTADDFDAETIGSTTPSAPVSALQ